MNGSNNTIVITTARRCRTMAKKNGDSSDRHKEGSRIGRIRPRYARQLQALADRRGTDFTEELNRAVRELLEREKLWPPDGE